MVSADEVATSKVRRKIIGIRRICEDGSVVLLTSIVKVIELPRDVFETKNENAKLADHVRDLEQELKNARSKEWMACIILEVASACINERLW